MPRRILDGDICKLTLYSSVVKQQAVNRLIFRAKAKVGLGMLDTEAAAQFSDDISSIFRLWMPAEASFDGVRFQVIRPLPTNYVVSRAGSGVGLAAGKCLPPQDAVCLQLLTDSVGKTNRGRIYLPMWDNTFLLVGGYLDNVGTTKAANFGTYLMGPLAYTDLGGTNGNTFELIIDSKGSTKAVPPILPHVTVVTGAKVDTSFATQRRRSNINRADTFGP